MLSRVKIWSFNVDFLKRSVSESGLLTRPENDEAEAEVNNFEITVTTSRCNGN